MRVRLKNFTDPEGSQDVASLAEYLQLIGGSARTHRRNVERARRAGVELDDRILEIGCGIGMDALSLAQHFERRPAITCVDLSVNLIRTARELAAAAKCPSKFAVCDARALCFGAASFDVCWAKRVLLYIDNPGRAVQELLRVLRPGGTVFVEEFDYATLIIDGPEEELSFRLTDRIRRSVFNPLIGRQLKRIVLEAGFVNATVVNTLYDFEDFAHLDNALQLRAHLRDLVNEGHASRAEAENWEQAMRERDRAGLLTACLPGFSIVAKKP